VGRLLALGSVLGLAAAGGGWSAVSWGWAALGLCWAAALALVLRPESPSRIELGFLGGLGAIAGWMALSLLWTQSVPSTVLEVERAAVYVAGVVAPLLLFRRGAEDGVLAAVVAVCAWNLGHRLTGYDPHSLGADAQPIGYANGLGLLAAIGCILALRRPWTWPALAVCAPALVLAHSAGSWLALAAGLAIAFRPRVAPLVAVVAAAVVLVGMGGHARTDYWDVALADARAHPTLGSGAGTYHQVWIERRPTPHATQDAHSLYLETLAELGPLGLLLVAGTLALPFVRGRGLALGAYAAFVVQAGIDWEWELPAVTLAGLFCGVAALRSSPSCNLSLARDASDERPEPPSDKLQLGARSRAAGVATVCVLAVLAAVGLAGNAAISRGDAAAARRWAPWSPAPYLLESRARGGDAVLLRKALAKEPSDWSLWAALAHVAQGPERRRAAERAARLNPLGAGAPSG
jgi:hypothetical protein